MQEPTLKPPAGLKMEAPWNHGKLFWALVNRGERTKESPKNRYVCLYPQAKNCAILSAPDADRSYRNAPIHINPSRDDWRPHVWEAIRGYVSFDRRDNKGPGQDAQNFEWYVVNDWDGLAKALGF